jgi:hypothetical protein
MTSGMSRHGIQTWHSCGLVCRLRGAFTGLSVRHPALRIGRVYEILFHGPRPATIQLLRSWQARLEVAFIYRHWCTVHTISMRRPFVSRLRHENVEDDSIGIHIL